MEEITFKVTNEETGELETVTAIHDEDLSNRKGYNPKFLGKKVPLPKLSSTVTDKIAQNNKPGKNGADYLDYTNFSVLFNQTKKLPFCTAVNITGASNELAAVHEVRKGDQWFRDERIKTGKNYNQFWNTDFAKSGFQKGHMVRFYDPAWGKSKTLRKTAMGDSFYYTNCCPQLGNYNAGVWNDLEDYYMARAVFQDEKVTVFTGPVFNKALEIGKLLVPVNFWKVIVYRKGDQLEAMGFLISHEIAYQKLQELQPAGRGTMEATVNPTLDKEDIDRLFTKKNLKKWVVKVALIEEKTGLKFGLEKADVYQQEARFFNINIDTAKEGAVARPTSSDFEMMDEDLEMIEAI